MNPTPTVDRTLDYVCRNDEPDNEFTIFAKIISEEKNFVVLHRFMRWGLLDCGTIKMSRKNFEEYYERRKET